MKRLANFIAGGVVAISLVYGAETIAKADTIVFDFEGQTATDELTTLALAQSGLTATITRPGSIFGIADLAEFPVEGLPASFGESSLAPVGDTETNTPLVASFSLPLSSVSIDMGDASSDVDTLVLEAFSGANATGTLLGSNTLTLNPSATPFAFSFLTLSVTTPGINSIRFIGGSPNFGNSVFYDNITVVTAQVAPVPEPATLLLLGTGLIGAAARGRRMVRRKIRQA